MSMFYQANYKPCTHFNEFPLPGLQDGSGFFLIPVDVMYLIIILEVLVQLLRTHQQEHALESLSTANIKSKKIFMVIMFIKITFHKNSLQIVIIKKTNLKTFTDIIRLCIVYIRLKTNENVDTFQVNLQWIATMSFELLLEALNRAWDLYL